MTDTVLATSPCSFPSPPLRSNDRGKWQAHHAKKVAVRTEGRIRGMALRNVAPSMVPIPGPVDVRLVWTVTTRHRRDADGPQPTLKAFLDGLVEAGVFTDDRHTVVRRAWCEIELYAGSHRHRPGVRVEVLAVTQPAAHESEDQ